MKKIIIFLFLFVSLLTNAQKVTVSGKIVDKNQKHLTGATVLVKETNQGISSDFDGNFSFKLNKGTFTLSVSFIGFKTIEKSIFLDEDMVVTIVLEEDENILDEVLVSAVRATSSIPVTYSNLSKKELAKRNLGQDIPILLNYLPSVISSSDASEEEITDGR